jgi:CRP-like cAMP-binding protein
MLPPRKPRGYDLDHMSVELLTSNLPTRRSQLHSGEALFLAGERVRRMYFVASGAVALVRSPSRKGADTVIHIARAGEWIAESSLFSDKYHCAAVARADCELVSAKRDEILLQLSADPIRSLKFAELLSSQLRTLRAMQEILRIRGTEERFLRWLFAHATGSPATLQLQGTWTELADTLALSREAMYRTVAKLRKSRVISVTQRRIVFNGSPRQRSPR